MNKNNHQSNLFSVLDAFRRMSPGASCFDLLAKQTTNVLEAAGCYGFERTNIVPEVPLLRKKYIVPVGCGGKWAGHDNEVAVYDFANDCWVFYPPVSGQQATMPDGETLYYDEINRKWSALSAGESGGGGSGGGDFNGDCPCEAPAAGTIYTIYTSQMTTPDGETEAVNGFETLSSAFKTLAGKRITIDKPVTFQIPAGIHHETEGVIHSSAQEGLTIQGASVPVTVTGVSSVDSQIYTVEYTDDVRDNWVSGTEIPYHNVTFQLESVSGLSVGEFLLIRDVVEPVSETNKTPRWPVYSENGVTEENAEYTFNTDEEYQAAWATFTSDKIPLYAACGAHEVLSIDAENNTVTVLLYNRVAPPVGTFATPLNCTVVQSVIRYVPSNASDGGIDAFKLESGGYLGAINNVALVGRCRPYTTDDGDLRGAYDYQEPVNYYGFLARQNTKFTFGLNSVVTGFCANCLLVQGSGLFQGFMSNSWGQNIGIGSGGSVRLVDCVSHGGWLDAVAVQDGGELTCQRCYFVGNARSGIIFSQGCTTGANSYIVAVYNGTRADDIGYTAGGNAGGIIVYGDAAAIQSLVAFNQWHGIIVSAAAQANLRNCHVFNNRRHGGWVLNGADAVFQDSSFYNNGLDNTPDTLCFDLVVRNSATATLANVFGRDSVIQPTFSPAPNTFGRTGGFITGAFALGDTNTQYIMSIASSTVVGDKRDLTVWADGRVMIGGIDTPGSYYSTSAGVELEVNGAIVGTDVIPMNAGAGHIGTSQHTWGDIWCANATINTSDWRIKDQIEVSPLGLSFINRLTPVKYKWLDYTEIKRKYRSRIIQGEDGLWYEKRQYIGDDPVEHTFIRPHYGLIAQQVKAAIEAEGQSDCAAYIKAEDTGTESLRYSELIAPLIRAIQELSARVEALEAAANVQPATYQAPSLPEYTLDKRTVVERPIEETITQIDYVPEDYPVSDTGEQYGK